MNRPTREALINDLVADAERPVPNGARTHLESMLWVVLSAVWVVSLTHLLGDLRPGVMDQLTSSPRLVTELALGLGTTIAFAHLAFRSALPGSHSLVLSALPALVLLVLWVGLHLYGFIDPTFAPSMHGKREHCEWQVFTFGIPVLAAGAMVLRRWWPRGAFSGAALGLAAGALPAMLMQIACMHEPWHILTHHLLPGLALGPIGAVIGFLVLQPPGRRGIPRP
ncbi:MAG: NrsF family protein [Pseudomonadota bacterium]